ncbi:M23 family metallopeptidase [Paenibacillus zanthoxyli]|uniref:M23 family metallopeptidase n=1 Tax=Paenibacillus zanthoxyli TaxID=369399 RepID=UPI00047200A0|nr:M23 family metallopeptidase [Paenibacillus zanthoxyli]
MKSQSDKIALLVVRDAGRPARKIQLSKPMAVALPAAAVLSLSSLISSMHYHASRSIQELEAEAAALSLQNVRLEQAVADNEKALQSVQSEALGLVEEAKGIKEQLKRADSLQRELQGLISKSQGASSSGKGAAAGETEGEAIPVPDRTKEVPAAAAQPNNGTFPLPMTQAKFVSPSAITIRIGAFQTAIEHTQALQIGGEYIASYSSPGEVPAVRETKDELTEIGGMLEEMVRSLSGTVLKAQKADTARLQGEEAQAFLWPTLSRTISSSFGYRTDPFKGSSAFHAGIDIAAQTGDVVVAAQGGVVAATEQSAARGNYIVIDHGNGLQTLYMHLSSLDVSAGDNVTKGQRIGQVGSTGRSTAPHLHFQVVKQNKSVNPLSYIKQD